MLIHRLIIVIYIDINMFTISDTHVNDLKPGEAPSSTCTEQWTCPHCTYTCNPSWAVNCDICDTSRNIPLVKQKTETCKDSCTLSDKSLKSPVTSPTTSNCSVANNVWICDHCTLENPLSSVSCHACHKSAPPSTPEKNYLSTKQVGANGICRDKTN